MSVQRPHIIVLMAGALLTGLPSCATAQGSTSSGPALVNVQQVFIDSPYISAFVDVRNKEDRAVAGLNAVDFSFIANGSTLALDKLDMPVWNEGFACALLMDVSGSVKNSFPAVRDSAVAWLQKLSSKDRVALMPVGSQIATLEFSVVDNSLAGRLAALSPSNQRTLLYGAILRALIGLRKAKDLPARRAIIIISDGVDEDDVSGTTSEDVKNALRDYEVPIYMLGVASTSTADVNSAIKPLTEVVRLSRGLYRPLNDGDPAQILAEFLDRIRRVYRGTARCEFCPADGQKHEIVMKVGQATSESLLIPFLSTHPIYTRLWFQALLGIVAVLIALTVWFILWKWSKARRRAKAERVLLEEQKKENERRRKEDEEWRRALEKRLEQQPTSSQLDLIREGLARVGPPPPPPPVAPWKVKIGRLHGSTLYDDVFQDRLPLNNIPRLREHLSEGATWEIRERSGSFDLVTLEDGAEHIQEHLYDNCDFHVESLTLRFYVERNQAG